MGSRFLDKFRRITYSTNYVPEIDGLRFLAIFAVVVVMHIPGYMNEKLYAGTLIEDRYWKNVVVGGGGGVTLFFMISGFILSLPFARWRLKAGKPIRLREYYLRRLTRLEPPYLIALTIFFAADVWLLGRHSFSQLLPHFFASAVYVHNFVYNSFSWILPVAWSLEVEVQFYLLAPLFFLAFLIRKNWLRWLIYLLVIIPASFYWFDTWTIPHVFKFIHAFVYGIMLADLYCCGVQLIRNQIVGFVFGMAALAGFIFIPSLDNQFAYVLRIFCMFLLFHLVLTNDGMKRVFSLKGITLIGGMCYSIYLLHFATISVAGRLLMRSGISVDDPLYFIPLAISLTLAVLVISAVYFLFVEKPFMKPFQFFRKEQRS